MQSRMVLFAAAMVILGPLAALAHEIRPAIANLAVGENRVEIDLLLTLEAIVAGLDLQGLRDTNEAANADAYDRLRRLEPDELAAEMRADWPRIAENFRITAGGAPVVAEIVSLDVDAVGDIELPRDSRLHLAAALPPDGSPITFGWPAEFGPLIVRQVLAGDGEGAYTGYLTSGEDSGPIPRTGASDQSALAALAEFIRVGFEHIVPKGLDHILFVLGLFFFSLQLRPLLFQITAFTLAHTVTLALATLGLVSVPAAVVEPLIAVSIAYVAVENVLTTEFRPWRTIVVFCFGLLHGLGFASVLGEVGLDPGRFVLGLIGFNLGVELGQLFVITLAFLAVGFWFGGKPWYRAAIAVPASVAIAFVGGYWAIERSFL